MDEVTDTTRRHRRQFLKSGALGALVAASAAASAEAGARARTGGNANVITVGGGQADFQDIDAAVASITDAGPSNPYLVQVLPGCFGPFGMKPWVSVNGSGRFATIVETDYNASVDLTSFAVLSSLMVRYSGNGGGEQGTAIGRGGEATDAVLRDLEVDVSTVTGAAGPRWGIALYGGAHDVTLYDVKIRTESCGVLVPTGNYRLHGVDCYLAPGSTGVPHIGLQVSGGSRFDWFGGRLGTGYYYDQELGDPAQDVIGAYIPASNTQNNVRLQLRDLDIYARSIDPLGGARVNAVRAENGWIRLFDTRCQTEAGSASGPSIWTAYGTPEQPVEGRGGLVEMVGSRGTQGPGDCFGINGEFGLTGPVTESLELEDEQAGIVLVDATLRPVTVTLPWSRFKTGRRYIVKRVDTSANPVFIDGGRNIDDRQALLLIPGRRTSVTIVAGRDQWWTL